MPIIHLDIVMYLIWNMWGILMCDLVDGGRHMVGVVSALDWMVARIFVLFMSVEVVVTRFG